MKVQWRAEVCKMILLLLVFNHVALWFILHSLGVSISKLEVARGPFLLWAAYGFVARLFPPHRSSPVLPLGGCESWGLCRVRCLTHVVFGEAQRVLEFWEHPHMVDL